MRSSKTLRAFIIGAVVFFFLIWLLDTALYPCTYLRNDVHTITTKQNDVLIMGTSNGKMGIDPDILLEGTGLTGHNLAAGSEYPIDSYYLMKLAIETHSPKKVIYDVDPGYFTTEKEKGNNYLLFYHEFPLSFSKAEYAAGILSDCDIRALLFPFYEYPLKTTFSRAGDTFTKKISGDYSVSSLKNRVQEYHENGFIEKFPVAEENFPAYDPEPFSEDSLIEENVQDLEKLIALCREKNIEFTAVVMPLPDHSLQVNQDSYEAAWDYFDSFFAAQNVRCYNFNREYYKSYSHKASHYVDYDGHLNGDSAREFSAIFGTILQ